MANSTFQQILDKKGCNIDGVDIAPNTLHPAEIVFEPAHEGAKFLSVRDSQHRPLMTFVACREHIGLIHTTVALHPCLYDLLNKELPPEDAKTATVEEAERALKQLEDTIGWLRFNLYVKKEESATHERRHTIMRVAQSVNLSINEIAETMKMKSRKEYEKNNTATLSQPPTTE